MNRADALAELDRAEASLAAVRAWLSSDADDTAAVAPSSAPQRGLADAAAFFDYIRDRPPLGPRLEQYEVDGCVRILGACLGSPLAYAAYILSTEVHETAGQMRPIAEYGKGAGKPYGQPGRNGGQRPYGRGDTQLTHDDNYERADRELGLNGALIANYELALDPEISARIIVRGMTAGWFTGKSLASYLPPDGPATHQQFVAARRIVNGTDRAELIAGYADTFQAALQAGGWA